MSNAVHVTVASDEVYLAPGGRRDVMLTVQNTGGSVEHYRLDVSGIPAACYALDPPYLTLPASASAHVHLAVHVPPDALVASGGTCMARWTCALADAGSVRCGGSRS